MTWLDQVRFEHEIEWEQYNELRASVNFITIPEIRAKRSLKNSLYKVVAYYEEEPIGMARVVGDDGYVYFICDVVVNPKFQSRGLGRKLIETIMKHLSDSIEDGDVIMVNLMSAMGKESFYEKMGFYRRPFEGHGSGMSCWISKGLSREKEDSWL